MNVIGFSNVLLKTRLHRDQTICIRTIKESGNAVIIEVDITKTDARKWLLRISLSTYQSQLLPLSLDIRYTEKIA
jgi:hypothetical protein